MGLNSDRAVLERIGKLVANNSCTPGEAVVKNADDCPGVTECPGTISQKVSYALTTNDNVGNECKTDHLGVFVTQPAVEGGIGSVSAAPCKQAGVLRITQGSINFQALKGLCPSTKSSSYLLNSTQDVDARIYQFGRGTCQERLQARLDFEGHLEYPVKTSKWIIKEAVQLHEDMHEEHFRIRLDSAMRYKTIDDKTFDDHIRSFNVQCSKYPVVDSAISAIKGLVQLAANGFYTVALEHWRAFTGAEGSPEELAYERSINRSDRMRILVESYKSRLRTYECR